jgi:hypothetical protein
VEHDKGKNGVCPNAKKDEHAVAKNAKSCAKESRGISGSPAYPDQKDEMDSSDELKIMKTILTLAIAILLSATVSRADVLTKGGVSALAKGPSVSVGTAAPAMKCAGCKSEFATVSAPNFKGSAPVASTVERHGCASCGTKWVTTGHGKAQVVKAVHTCGDCKS